MASGRVAAAQVRQFGLAGITGSVFPKSWLRDISEDPTFFFAHLLPLELEHSSPKSSTNSSEKRILNPLFTASCNKRLLL